MTNLIETCSLCGGTGWQTIERGKEREATPCGCRLRGRAERLLSSACIPLHYRHCDFESFICDPDDPEEKSIFEAKFLAGRFVEKYPTERPGLLLVGPAGVGKTHLAIGIIKQLIHEKEVQCLFCDYRELLKSIQDSYNPSVQATEMGLLRPVLDVPVLLLDDLAAVRSSEWIFDIVNYILNSRYNRDGTTIITTNFPDEPEQQTVEFDNLRSKSVAERIARGDTLGDRIGRRMWSRLHEMCTKIPMEGLDRRQGLKKAKYEALAGPKRFSVARNIDDKQMTEIERSILELIKQIAGHRRGNQIRGWRRLIEATGVVVKQDLDVISAFERLQNSGFLQLSNMTGEQYFGTAKDRNSFFEGFFAAQLTKEGLQYFEYVEKERG